ncbi:hypothetical protein HPB50_002710 [Hyalomma asiaticum]|uniref:Uncharacterized protein n=1 Tax=Hyalomma asiaticum TaxID=266040 RepID=A0ACB7TDF9_HYAAI|nr:hypothetical protein HPB50_002710 [Hyalomma asiaticum]
MLRNPFCFIVQVLAILLPAQPYLCEKLSRSPIIQARDIGFEMAAQGDPCLIYDLIAPSVIMSATDCAIKGNVTPRGHRRLYKKLAIAACCQ